MCILVDVWLSLFRMVLHLVLAEHFNIAEEEIVPMAVGLVTGGLYWCHGRGGLEVKLVKFGE